jgi:hypothetical protein
MFFPVSISDICFIHFRISFKFKISRWVLKISGILTPRSMAKDPVGAEPAGNLEYHAALAHCSWSKLGNY